jgi:phosphohistidine phosphatase SixA
MKNTTSAIALAALSLGASVAYGEIATLDGVLPSLKQGGYVIVLRHGATDPKQTDVYPLDYRDMTKQRQLSDQGRQGAEQIGAAFKKLGIPVGDVYTSRLNRAVETGRLVSGKDGIGKDELNDSSAGSASAMAGSAGGGSASHGNALRKMADTAPKAGTNTLIVTHKTNVTDAFGQALADVAEAEALVFKPNGTGAALVARVRLADWGGAAAR